MNTRIASVGIALSLTMGLALILAAGVTGAAAREDAQTPAATVRYVAPGGACGGASPCYATIQAAVDAAAAGDEVRVASGVYSGVSVRKGITQVVFLDKPLALSGGYTRTNWNTANPPVNPTVVDARDQGRGLVISGTHPAPVIQGLRITGGNAGEAYFGGGVYAVAATLVFSSNWVYSNTAGVGAGLHLEGCPDVALTENRFYQNAATEEGGGVSLGGSDRATLRRNQVYSNTSAGNGGGGSVIASADVLLTENAWRQNRAGGDGGGLVILAGLGVTLTKDQVYANRADGNGGGIATGGGMSVLTHNDIYSNTAAGEGGGVILVGDFGSELTGNQVHDNTATEGCGGGLRLMATFSPRLDSNRVYANSAQDGGGICLDFNDSLRLTNSEVFANRAAGNGGGAYISDIGPTVTGNHFYSNTAGGSGGGLYLFWIAEGATLSANQVASNTALAEGGGIYALSSDHLSMRANRVWSNVAGGAGGAGLFLQNSHQGALVNNAVLDNHNSQSAAGAGLYLDYTGDLRLMHTTIARNSGPGSSAIFITNSIGNSDPPASSVLMTNTILVSHSVGINVATGNHLELNGILWHATPVTVTRGATATVTAARQWIGSPAFDGDGYHLTGASAAIDRGVNAGVADDIDGEPRPRGAGYDLGADEWVQRRLYLPLIRR